MQALYAFVPVVEYRLTMKHHSGIKNVWMVFYYGVINNVKIMVLLILEKFSNIKMIIFHKEIIPNRMNK